MNAVYQGYHNRVVALKGKNGGGWLTMADQCGRCRGKLGISISLSSGTMAGQWVRIKACEVGDEREGANEDMFKRSYKMCVGMVCLLGM